MITLPAWHRVGALKHRLPLLVFAPLPLSPWKHTSSPISLGLGQAEPSIGFPTQPLPAHGGASLQTSPVRAPLSCSLSSWPWRSGPQGSTARSIASKPP